MSRGAEMIIKISGDAKKFEQELGKLEKNASGTLSKISSQAKIAGAALAATAAAIGISSFNEFAKFEEKFSNVITLLDDGSFKTKTLTKGIADLRQGILDLSAKSGQSFDTLNQGLFDLISAGVDAESAIKTLTASTNLAIAGATDTATAVDGVTNALGAYSLNASEAQVVAEKFFTAQKFGKTTIEEIASGIGTVASSAKGAGISFDELLASTAAVTTSAIGQNEAFTGLKAAIGNINQPSQAAREEAKRLGIEFETGALRAKGLKGFLDGITTSAGFNADSLKTLFGSQEALNFMIALTGSSADEFNKILGENSNATQRATTFTDALETKMATSKVTMDQLRQSIAAAKITMGEYIAPSVIEFTKDLTDSVNDNKDSFILLGRTIEKFLQVVSLAKNFLVGFANIFTNVVAAAVTGVTGSVLTLSAELDDLTGKGDQAAIKRAQADELFKSGGAGVTGAVNQTADAVTGDVNSIFGVDLQTSLDRQKQLQDAQNQLLREGLEEQNAIRAEAEAEGQEQGITKDVASQTEDQFEETAETQEERLKRLQEARDAAAQDEISASKKRAADLLKIEEDKKRKLEQLDSILQENLISNAEATFGKQTAIGKALFLLRKAFAIKQVIVNTQDAMSLARATIPPPGGDIQAAKYAIQGATSAALIGAQAVQGIKAQRGGIVPGLGAGDRVPAMLEADEIVVPKKFNPLSPDFESTFGGGIGGGQVDVMIGIEPDASRIITARQVEDQKLGISR